MTKASGLLFVIAGFILWMGITTAEIFYPGYSVSKNFISTLGASPPPDSIILQPSASIFDGTMILAGLLIILATIVFFKTNKDRFLEFALLFMGVGALGVGTFPAYTGIVHLTFAFTAFGAGGIAAILSFRTTNSPFKYLAAILGLTTLGFLLVGKLTPDLIVPTLGRGGAERWVAYPVMVWLIGYGGYLMAPFGSKKS